MSRLACTFLAVLFLQLGCASPEEEGESKEGSGNEGVSLLVPGEEKHLRNLRSLTRNGEDAEAYFSPSGEQLVLQTTREDHEYDQIYLIGTDGKGLRRISPGPGKTTCSFFFPEGDRIVYATTHLNPDEPVRGPDPRKGEAWVLDTGFDVVSCRLDGTDIRRLTAEAGYDAECAVSRADGRIVFCSMRSGDPELYIMNRDGTEPKQLTSEKGYDGGPFFSVDGKKIIWRTYQPPTPEKEKAYEGLIARNAVGRWPLDIWIMKTDGTGKKRLTTRGEKTGHTCWAPYLHPDNRHVVFVSTSGPRKRGARPNFDLHLLDMETGGIERVTFDGAFDAFPMFSDDGKRLVFCSSRRAAKRGEVGIFIADWIP